MILLMLACQSAPINTSTNTFTGSHTPDTGTDTDTNSKTDTAADTGTAITSESIKGSSGSVPMLARGKLDDGRTWAVTLLDGENPWPVAITSPAEVDDTPLPVALGMYGGLARDPGCDSRGPNTQLLLDVGMVEIRVLGGTQCCAGI